MYTAGRMGSGSSKFRTYANLDPAIVLRFVDFACFVLYCNVLSAPLVQPLHRGSLCNFSISSRARASLARPPPAFRLTPLALYVYKYV